MLGGEIQRIDDTEKEDRKDIEHLNKIISDNKKMGWFYWLDIALELGNLFGMGVNAFMFFKMKVFGRSFYTHNSGSGSGSSLQDIRGEQAPLLHEAPRMFLEAETQCSAMAGHPVSAIQINSNVNQLNTTKSNTTITHYYQIEESINPINDFIVGAPLYLRGKVYKYSYNHFIPSTEADSTDCICSVKTNYKWNEFVGICVKIDDKNKCVTFATHGDYLLKVTDTSCYGIGYEVFIDEVELKTLTGQTAVTSKITSKINDTMLAVFKA